MSADLKLAILGAGSHTFGPAVLYDALCYHKLRNIELALVRLIGADMPPPCPTAPLINLADPLPRVCQAAHEEEITTVGLCSHSLIAYKHAWELLHDEKLAYPFDVARSMLDVAMAGL